MFGLLLQRIDEAIQKFKAKAHRTETGLAITVKSIRRALVDASVPYSIAQQVAKDIKAKALECKVLTSIDPRQWLIKIVYEEFTKLMGGRQEEIDLKGNPAVILISGLQGAGKTTFSGKLASWLQQKQHKKVLLVACNVRQPAAIEQLRAVGEQIGAEVYAEPANDQSVAIAQNALKYAQDHQYQVLIVDTVGRLVVDELMTQEIAQIKTVIQPSETLFVVDVMAGQEVVNAAKTFGERIDFDGLVLTKVDGDTRGGVMVSIYSEVNKPIKFIGTGERMNDLNAFCPEKIAGRILGLDDIIEVNPLGDPYEEDIERMRSKMHKNRFSYDHFLAELQKLKDMDNPQDLIETVPGFKKFLRNVDLSDESLKTMKAMVCSMTPNERQSAVLLNDYDRRRRIAKGSGASLSQVNLLIKQFANMRQVMKKLNRRAASKMWEK